ncbi:hypothetical protein HGRIS_013726 [Hohenbuehelia grisea]|uniref:ABC transporter domain-containing protein n=1 Tax=Hohenbuehelia grisea TaxID=104357 RepID=A0ABR3IWL3_9AGAR
MSCQVINPTLQALFPLQSTLNIMLNLHPDLSPIPNTTSFGPAGAIYAQLFYAGVEQFYCGADSCTQELDSNGEGTASWMCLNLKCSCRKGTTFCSGVSDLSGTIDVLSGTLGVSCGTTDNKTRTSTCAFKQSTLQSLFGSGGLTLDGCAFGECVRQNVIDSGDNSTMAATTNHGKPLSGGVIAGLAVVGSILFLAFALLAWGFARQRAVKRRSFDGFGAGGIAVEWSKVSYVIPSDRSRGALASIKAAFSRAFGYSVQHDNKTILDSLSGRVQPGQMMAILGPSGAGKTTLVEIIAGRSKSGITTGTVSFPPTPGRGNLHGRPRIGFVPQQDVLPPMLTVHEALVFAAKLRLPENIPEYEKEQRIESIMNKLGIESIRNSRIGWNGESGGGRLRGISGGEMRRVSIALEMVASPDVLILDEPTSGLDSVSAAKVANALHAIAHDEQNPTAVIASIHQPSSKLYQTFDQIMLLSFGHALYAGPGGFAPAEHFANQRQHTPAVPTCPAGYNVADYLLEVASDPPVGLFHASPAASATGTAREQTSLEANAEKRQSGASEKAGSAEALNVSNGYPPGNLSGHAGYAKAPAWWRSGCATTFLTQLEVLSGREWKILQRDFTLFFAHIAVASVLGVFCGGLYFKTDFTIAGFQSRVGCLFFLGALIAFSSLSALYNVVETRALFLRERSSAYYSPSAWLLSRFFFDVIPLRIMPTIIVSTITYWMAGLAHDAEHFFKFLFILVLFSFAMTLFNFLLGTLFTNGGIAILLSAISALYQMTFAGFFVHLNDIPPVLRWLQWICPLKFTLEALAVNEVGSGLMIQDTLEGVPVNVSASLIMNTLFGFGANNYYRDVLVLFAFIAGFGLGVIGVVMVKVRERR